MTKYEELITEAEKNGAKVVEIDFGTKKKCGKCVDNYIFINSNLSDRDKIGILSEELGHYNLTVGNITKLKNINEKKQEFKARRWGYKHIVSLEGIIEAFENNCLNQFEMAEYLGVSDEYFSEAIQDYKKQYGIYCTLDKYCIVLEPRLGIYKDFEYS